MMINNMMFTSFIPRPLPPQGDAWYTLFVHAQNIFCEKLSALPCAYVEDYTNQEYKAFFELDPSDNLTCRTLLGYYFSDVAVSFSKRTYSPTER